MNQPHFAYVIFQPSIMDFILISNVSVHVKNLYPKVDGETIGQSSVRQKHDLSGCSRIDCTRSTQSYLCKITTMFIQVYILHLKSKILSISYFIISDELVRAALT